MRKVNYINIEFGQLKVIGFDDMQQKWICSCLCGNTVYYTSRQLQTNQPKSCGCLRSKDLTGRTFERLKVIERTDKRDDNYNVFYLCECICKNTKLVTATDLLKGNVKSCGCLANEQSIEFGKIGAESTKEVCVEGTNVRNLTMKLSSRNTSGVKGVTWDKAKNKWKAQIRFKGKNYHLGRYETIEDATKVRKLAEDKLFGEFLEWYAKEYGANK